MKSATPTIREKFTEDFLQVMREEGTTDADVAKALNIPVHKFLNRLHMVDLPFSELVAFSEAIGGKFYPLIIVPKPKGLFRKWKQQKNQKQISK